MKLVYVYLARSYAKKGWHWEAWDLDWKSSQTFNSKKAAYEAKENNKLVWN